MYNDLQIQGLGLLKMGMNLGLHFLLPGASKWRPNGSQSRIKKCENTKTVSGGALGRPRDAPGSLLDTFLASFGVSICKDCVLLGYHFGFNFCVLLKCIFGDSRSSHGVCDLKKNIRNFQQTRKNSAKIDLFWEIFDVT